MNCPYCVKDVYGMTGLQELHAFEKHLRKCRKNPANVIVKVGRETRGGKKTIFISGNQTFKDVLEIRAESGQ